jgi:hypothetical protein
MFSVVALHLAVIMAGKEKKKRYKRLERIQALGGKERNRSRREDISGPFFMSSGRSYRQH